MHSTRARQVTNEEPGVLRLVTRRGAKTTAHAGTADYYARIEAYAQRIRQTDDVADIIRLLQDALTETRALHSVDELTSARRQVRVAEERIEQLTSELELISQLVCEDPLTGALNRRGLEELLERESARAERERASLCAALIDIDDFKRINDHYGHPAGDRVLRHVVSVARDVIRGHDAVGRYGGEEFVLVLPRASAASTTAIVQRLRRELEPRAFQLGHSGLKVTFSAGIAERRAGEHHASLLARADRALYEAKRLGKDRALVAP